MYTSIFGGYDTLKPHPDIPGVDWVCFTDDPALRQDGWTVAVDRPRYDLHA